MPPPLLLPPLPTLILALLICLSVVMPQGAAAARDCGGEDAPCGVPLGTYHVAAPPDWDGTKPLPAMLFLHGYNSSGTAYLRNSGFVAAWQAGGVLLILPNGVPGRPGGPRSWAHQGSPNQAREDLAFLDEVVSDVRAHYPVSSLWASGFSQGGSMVWDLACYRSEAFDGFFSNSGGFWAPLPLRCKGPLRLRHSHGTADGVVPLAGRQLGLWRQGDIRQGWEVLKAAAACPAEPTGKADLGPARCSVWSDCQDGHLELCLFDGGHRTPAGWIGQSLEVIRTGWPSSHPQ